MLRGELDQYLSSFLDVAAFDDESLNGLQVEGREEVRRLAFGVSACAEVFRKAVAAGADAIVVHHGLFWRKEMPRPVTGLLKDRLKILLDGGCSLFAYHLPLDAHPEVGNNAVACRAIGLEGLEPFCRYHGSDIGFRGRFHDPLALDLFIDKLESYYGHKAHVVPGTKAEIATVGIVSGGAAREAEEAVAAGLDAYVTGEPGEPTTYVSRESGFTFAALGHYATERVGVQALAAHLGTRFPLETFFVEVDNEA